MNRFFLLLSLLFCSPLQGQILNSYRFADNGVNPSLTSATIDGTTLTLVFNEAVSQGAGYNDSDIDVDMSTTGNDIAVTYSSGDGTSRWVYTTASAAVEGETVDLDFNGDANSIEDTQGNDLGSLTSESVTNDTGGGPSTTNLLAWWSMDETGTATRADSDTDVAYDLTANGAGVNEVSGVVSNAVYLTASEYLSSASFPNTVHTSDFTVGMWINIQTSGSANWHCIGQWGASTTLWLLYHNPNTEILTFLVDASAGSDGVATSDATWDDTDGNIFVVGVRSGDTMTLYVNGSAQSTTGDLSSSTESSGDVDLWINREANAYGDCYYDECFIFTEALSSDDITWLYNSGSGRSYGDL